MEQIKIYHYYSFGYNYRILLDGNSNLTNKQCYDHIKSYNDFIRRLDLGVTTSSIGLVGLIEDMTKLQKLVKAKRTRDNKVEEAFWKQIIEKLKKVDTTLDAELNTKIAYLLNAKRYSNEILLKKIYHLFSTDTYAALPEIAQFDFEEAGKCLAFDRYTACGFHSLRGTEDVLKMFYEKVIGVTAIDSATWGTFETAITEAIARGTLIPPPEEQLIINIRSLRKYYRNKTQHPQNTYSSDEAQDLLSLCIKTVNELVADLRSRGLLS